MQRSGRWNSGRRRTLRIRLQDEYMLMLRVDDWKLARKTELFHSIISDIYAFPPFQHITLYGPFRLKPGMTPESIFQAVESASAGMAGLPFRLYGYLRLTGRRGQAITHQVLPSSAFLQFHDHLWRSLSPVACSLSWIDRDAGTRRFHITHAYNLRNRDADQICDAIRRCQTAIQESCQKLTQPEKNNGHSPDKEITPVSLPDYAPLTAMRVVILKNGVIVREFDLPAREWLTRQLAFDSRRTAVSLMQFRKIAGLELAARPEPTEKPPFFSSDLHLGHKNIIRYCRRPFTNAGEMDRVLISNWNYTVGETDPVFFLGDLRYGSDAPPVSDYLPHLNGRITFIRGNHDQDIPDAIPGMKIRFEGEEFLFIHDPADAPPEFNGWVIHGHFHNNDLRRFPFIDFQNRRVNASIELTAYRPVSLPALLGILNKYSGHDQLETMPVTVPLSRRKISK
jgi:calcineurin-like phosphoesterase family protein